MRLFDRKRCNADGLKSPSMEPLGGSSGFDAHDADHESEPVRIRSVRLARSSGLIGDVLTEVAGRRARSSRL